jgi:2-phospho-L-lactate transferase/gluconeogenesis factor (CofD/UPF0052 family)
MTAVIPVSARDASATPLRVVLFSGGRGSAALSRQLISSPNVELTVVINGYDDGASTGEVRRFLGDALGPSDFRKNASNLAGALRTCPPSLLDLLELRFPEQYTAADAVALLGEGPIPPDGFASRVARVVDDLPAPTRDAVAARLDRFVGELRATRRSFAFGDCSVGNLVFAGGFLLADRDFNRAVDDYCALVGLKPGTIENVTSGTNAYLVAVEHDGRVLATEAEIVDAARPNRIRDIFLIARPLTAESLGAMAAGEIAAGDLLVRDAAPLTLNPRVGAKIAVADLIIYGPGTQHSSLFPSYLTPGLGGAIAGNRAAMKVLVTNIQPDAEIGGSSAVDLVEKAGYYLKNKGQAATPIPFLITHSLLNDPSIPEASRPYVPIGSTDTIEDPRLVRIGNYEDGVTGRHHAGRVLEPFIASIVGRRERRRVAVLLTDSTSLNKVTQTLLELVRGGIERVPIDVTVFYASAAPLAPDLASGFPFEVHHLAAERDFAAAARQRRFEYVLIFESSGMYRGEETVPLLAQLTTGRLDAVWGSRRLSLRDIEESYRLRYSASALQGALSYAGSYLLSVACLVLYGRHISDTLSGVRAVRADDVLAQNVDLTHKNANHELLSRLLRRKADIVEMPVRFVPLSPEKVKRTTALEGLSALATLIGRRFSRPATDRGSTARETESATTERTVE